MIKLDFDNQKMLIVSVNARAEVHGDQKEPAGDIGLSANLPNDTLSLFHPSLKSKFYHYDGARPQDLADAGRKKEPGWLPHLQLPQLKGPFEWDDEMVDASVTIKVAKKEVTLSPVKINKFQFNPLDGGTVKFSMRVQTHWNEKELGALGVMVQQEVEVTVKSVAPSQPKVA